MNLAPEALAVIDAGGSLHLWNTAFAELFGLETAAGTIEIASLVADAAGRKCLNQAIAETFGLSGRPATIATEALGRDRTISVRWRLKIFAEGGKNLAVLSAVALPSADAASEKLDAFLAASLQGTVVYGSDGPLFCSDRFARMFGYADGAAFVAKGPRDENELIVPEQREALQNLAKELAAGPIKDGPRQTEYYELRALTKNQQEIWVALNRRSVSWDGIPARLITAYEITRRKRSELKLHEYDGMLQRLADSSQALILFLDRSGRIKFTNSAFERFSGIPAAATIDTLIDTYVEPRTGSHLKALLARVFEGETVQFKETIRDRRGRRRRLSAQLVPETSLSGTVRGAFCVALDVTGREHAAQALHDSEMLLRNLINASPAHIACLDRKKNYIFVNEKLASLAGKKVEELTHRRAALTTGDSRFAVSERAFNLALNGSPVTFQSELKAPDGSVMILENHYRPRFKNEAVIGVFIVSFDVTEREHTARGLQESEERFRRLIEIIPYGIARVDRNACIKLSNPAHDRMFGYQPGQLWGRTPWELFIPSEQDIQKEVFTHIIEKMPEPFPNLGRCMRTDGRVIDILINWNYEYDRSGEVNGLICVVTDVTDELNAKRELQIAKEQAERANLEKSRFLAAASHDLQQPLHSLSIMLGLLEHQRDKAKRTSIIAMMERAVDGARALLRAVLDLSKLEAGVIVPRLEAISIDDLFTQIEAELGPQTEGRPVELRVVRSSVEILSDRVLVKSILHNLVSNAIRYTRKGKVLIGGRRRGAYFVLQVWDTGIGIPKDRQKDIFQEFTRLDYAREDKDQIHALGLGLSIVERACELLGHRIEVTSEVGKGSVFSVAVPLVRNHGALLHEKSHLPVVVPHQQNRVILLLEDNRTTALATHQLIESWGHRCLVAMSEAEALALIEKQRETPDLIIADFNLETTRTGIEVADHLIELIGHPVPTILVTANEQPECLETARVRGIPLINKPAPPARLRALISFLLARSDPESS